MWKNRKAYAFLLALMMVLGAALSVSAESELIPQEEIKADTVRYLTEAAYIGELVKSQSCSAAQYYPKSSTLLYTGKQAVFVRQISERTGEVKAGDKIIELAVVTDEVAVAELELKLQRTKENFAEELSERREKIAEMIAERDQETDTRSAQKKTILIQISQVELEQYENETNESIADMEAELSELYADREPVYVTAPIDGKISDMTYYHEGDIINTGAQICTVTDESVVMINCPGTALRYGIDATVESNRKNNTATLSGRVVMTSSVIPDSQGDFSIIELRDVENYTGSWMNMTAHTNQLDIENVLLIPNRAKETSDNRVYVTILDENSVLHRRQVKIFLNSQTESWVLAGLSEGDLVIAD